MTDENILADFMSFLNKSAALIQEQAEQMQSSQAMTGNNASRMESTNPFGSAGEASGAANASPAPKPMTDTSQPLKPIKFKM